LIAISAQVTTGGTGRDAFLIGNMLALLLRRLACLAVARLVGPQTSLARPDILGEGQQAAGDGRIPAAHQCRQDLAQNAPHSMKLVNKVKDDRDAFVVDAELLQVVDQ